MHNNNVDLVVGNPFKRNEPHHKSCYREGQDYVTATGSNNTISRFDFEGLKSSQEDKLDLKKKIKTWSQIERKNSQTLKGNNVKFQKVNQDSSESQRM